MKKHKGKQGQKPKKHSEDHVAKKTEEKTLLQGIISINSKGVGFAKIEGREEDIVIEETMLNTAFHGDEVSISILSKKDHRGRTLGSVEKILKRNKERFVGVLEKAGENFFLLPDDQRTHKDFFISKKNAGDGVGGEKVQIEFLKWDDPKKNPEGKIIKILGAKGDNDVEISSIVLERGFEIEFPEGVEKEANEIERSEKPVQKGEIAKRKDFRNTTTFTIDPFDAKDFDDAISYKELDENLVEIGVHIADVSYYVREHTELDKEALKRGCSVYLVDRTIPMLPEVLSNDLCSLRPLEDKLAFSSVFVINKNTAEVKERWFGRTIINSNKRFTYEDAQETLNKKTGEFFSELETLNRLAKIMQKEKWQQGAIDFETEEVKFKLDEKGKPLGVYKKARLDTHKLVEEFMLLANREVAEFIFSKAKIKDGAVGIYRVHDAPKTDRIADLALFIKALGHHLPVLKGKVTSKDINALLKSIVGTPEESLIKTATIRSMAKAIYSPVNVGHFGLAFTFYTHFTSPIRRYPDLLVHRILQNHLGDAKISKDEYIHLKKMADHSTDQEIKASEAERASIKMKQVEYMSEHIGEEFDGTISGVTEWGIYVEEINTRCEGMVKLRDMKDDYYVLDQKNYCVVGEKTKKKYSLGDKVRFKVLSGDVERKTLDYSLI